MKFTLLQMTQDVLSSMSSDEVNSISDTTESLQVATIIRQKYFDIINRLDLPDHDQLIQLQPSLDQDSPVLMYIPDGVASIKSLKYFDSNPNPGINFTQTSAVNNALNGIGSSVNWSATSSSTVTVNTGDLTFSVASGLKIKVSDPVVITTTSSANVSMTGTVKSYTGTTLVVDVLAAKGSGTYSNWSLIQGVFAGTPPGYKYVTILPNTQFIDYVNSFNPSDFNVYQFTFKDTSNNFDGSYTFYYRDDHTPSYCTVISNYYVIFDSFDAGQDSTLQANKTMAIGEVIPVFKMEDTFIPNLTEDQFQLLLNESKALSFYELKQQPHDLAIQETKRGWSNIQKQKSVVNRPTYFNELPDYGRRGKYLWAQTNDGNWNWKWR